MCERDIEVLVCGGVGHVVLGCRQGVKRSVNPGESYSSAGLGTVTSVVMVHDVICVFEAEPFVRSEEFEVAEWRGTSNNGLITTEKRHRVHIGSSEIEDWSGGIKASDSWLSVYVQK